MSLIGCINGCPKTDTTVDHGLPASIDAEKSVLGGILVDNQHLPQAQALLMPDDFAIDSHRRIFAAMLDLAAEASTVDVVTLSNKLAQLGQMQAIGGVAYLSSLTDGMPRRVSIEHWVKIVHEKARRRRLIHLCSCAVSQAVGGADATSACIAQVQEGLLELEAGNEQQPIAHVKKYSAAVMDELLEQRARGKNVVLGKPLGIAELDTFTTGMREGELWLLAGRPGEGKSVLAAQAMAANCSAGRAVGVFSPELTKEQLLRRILVQRSGTEAWKLRKAGYLTDPDVADLRATMETIAEWPLYVDDSSAIEIGQLAARARLMKQRHKIELLVVDYVQLITAKGKDERAQVSRISKVLTQIAKDVVPVLALSQMPRPERREKNSLNRRPTKYDLKESSALEQDASTVLLIFREVDTEHHLPTGNDELLIAKQRHGELGVVPVTFLKDRLMYVSRLDDHRD